MSKSDRDLEVKTTGGDCGKASETDKNADNTISVCGTSDNNCEVSKVKVLSSDGQVYVVSVKVARQFVIPDSVIEDSTKEDYILMLNDVKNDLLKIMIQWAERHVNKGEDKVKKPNYIDRLGNKVEYGTEDDVQREMSVDNNKLRKELLAGKLDIDARIKMEDVKVEKKDVAVDVEKKDVAVDVEKKDVAKYDKRETDETKGHKIKEASYYIDNLEYEVGTDDGEVKRTDDIDEFDNKLLDLEPEMLFRLLNVAHKREMADFLNVLVKKTANLFKGKTARQLRETFTIRRIVERN